MSKKKGWGATPKREDTRPEDMDAFVSGSGGVEEAPVVEQEMAPVAQEMKMLALNLPATHHRALKLLAVQQG
ncbi:MAG: hypothetical protein KC492_10165, partial [Myxococcales bacterium]|nr:hypothetical protein [Myxococcales bacterium]